MRGRVDDILDRARRVLLLGYGRSGRSVEAVLAARGVPVRVADRRTAEEAGVHDPGADWWRDHDPEALDGVDLVIKSPGFDRRHPLVAAAIGAGVPVVGELEIGWAVTPAPLVSVTGSNGKSTATALLAHMFSAAGIDTVAAGNIGEALTGVGPDLSPLGAAVVEVSSFQIEDLLDYRSRVAMLLNVSPDHLDRHGTFEHYRAIKASLLERVDPDGLRVVPADDPGLAPLLPALARGAGARLVRFALDRAEGVHAYRAGTDLVVALDGAPVVVGSTREMTLDGPHNVRNALAAALVAVWWGVSGADVATAIRTFRPLPHRMERVARLGEVLFVNDSKATNLDALRMALQTFPDPVVLIAGGRDKASPFAELADTVRERVRALILIGEAADAIAAAWPEPEAVRASSMEEAVARATEAAYPRSVVLLAPGCASFDMFRSFEHRGDAFKQAVDAMVGAGRNGHRAGEG